MALVMRLRDARVLGWGWPRGLALLLLHALVLDCWERDCWLLAMPAVPLPGPVRVLPQAWLQRWLLPVPIAQMLPAQALGLRALVRVTLPLALQCRLLLAPPLPLLALMSRPLPAG